MNDGWLAIRIRWSNKTIRMKPNNQTWDEFIDYLADIKIREYNKRLEMIKNDRERTVVKNRKNNKT